MSLLLSSFYPNANAVLTSNNQTISGVKTFVNTTRVDSVDFIRNFRATGTPYNFTSNRLFNFGGATGQLFTGWNLASINPSDDSRSIRLSSGSYVVINFTQVNGSNGVEWAVTPNSTDLSNNLSFNLFNGSTPFNRTSLAANQSISFSGFLPREYNRFIIKRLGGGGDLPSINVSGDFGVNNEIRLESRNNRLFLGNSGVLFQGEAAAGGTVTLTSDILFTTGTQTVTGPKNFTARPTFNNSNLITASESIDSFDGNRPIKRVPSLSDPAYGGTTISGFLENMFFPYLQGSLTLSSVTSGNANAPFTYGISSPNVATFNGSYNQRDDQFQSFQFFRTGAGGLFTALTQFNPGLINPFSSGNISLGSTILNTTDNIFGVRVNATRNSQPLVLNSTLGRIRFEPRYYWGLSNLTSLNASQITGLLNPVGPDTSTNFYNNYGINGKPLNVEITYTNPINQFLYFVYPGETKSSDFLIDWGSFSSIVDSNGLPYSNEFQNIAGVIVTFPNGKSLGYRVVKSLNTFNLPGGSFTFRFNL